MVGVGVDVGAGGGIQCVKNTQKHIFGCIYPLERVAGRSPCDDWFSGLRFLPEATANI